MTRYSSEARKEHLPDQNRIMEMEYFQSLYPQRMRKLQKYVVEECDRMDYKGSPMYDEYPDMLMIEQACRRICSRIPKTMYEGGSQAEGSLYGSSSSIAEASYGEGSGMIDDVESVEIYEADPSRYRWGRQFRTGSSQDCGFRTDASQIGSLQNYEFQNCSSQSLPPGPSQNPPPGWAPQNPLPGWAPQNPPPGWPPQNPPPQSPPPQNPPSGKPPGLPPQGPPQNSPNTRQPNWMQDITRLLLINEMLNRRCRLGRC